MLILCLTRCVTPGHPDFAYPSSPLQERLLCVIRMRTTRLRVQTTISEYPNLVLTETLALSTSDRLM